MRKNKKPFLALIISFSCLILSGIVIWFLPPSIWTEPIILVALTISLFLFCGWMTKSKKYSILITILIFGLLLLNRFAALNIITAGLLAAILGLIALNT